MWFRTLLGTETVTLAIKWWMCRVATLQKMAWISLKGSHCLLYGGGGGGNGGGFV